MAPTHHQPPEPPTTQETMPGALDELKERLDVMEDTIRELRFDMQENTAVTKEVKEIIDAASGAWKVLGWISSAAKYGLTIIAFAALTLAAIKGWFISHDGGPPQ